MSSRCQPKPPSTRSATFTGSDGPGAACSRGSPGPRAGRRSGIACANASPAALPVRSRQRRRQSRCMAGWSSSVARRAPRSSVTISFSPGASGFGSADDVRDRDHAGLAARRRTRRRSRSTRAGAGRARRPRTRTRRRGATQRHRPLRERAERLAQVHVEAAQVLGHALDLVDDRREHQLQRLGEREPLAVDQGLDRARRGPASRSRRAAAARRASAPPGAGGAIVLISPLCPSTPKGCTRAEGGPGVGRVAVVAEHAGASSRARRARSG